MKNQKFSALYNIALIQSAYKTLVGLSKAFKNRRQRQNFITLLLSIITQGTPILSRVNEINNSDIPWYKRLSHFLKSGCIPDLAKHIYHSFIKKYLANLTYIALDWTALVKTGINFEYECTVYDSRDKREHDGFPLLLATGFSKDKKQWLPLSWRLTSWTAPDFISENELIFSFINELVVFLKNVSIKLKNRVIFLMDRGFARKLIITTLLEYGLLFIIQAYEDRLIVLPNGKRTKFSKLTKGFYENVTIVAWNLTLNVVVGGCGDNRKVLLTNLKHQDYSLNDIWSMFATRGKIEPNIKELKQGVGLEKFMVRSFQSIDTLISFMFLAYAITQNILLKFRKLLLWVRRRILRFRTRAGRISADILRRLLHRIAFFGYSDKLKLMLAKYRPLPP